MKQRTVLSLLSLTSLGSLLAAAATVFLLNPEDRISVKRGSLLTGLGFVFFLSLFDLLNEAILRTASGERIRNKYKLSCGEVLDITNKLVSAVQAALCCFTGAVVCLWSCTRDLLHSNHFMSEAYAWFGAAYFFYDIWSMYKVHIYMCSERRDKDAKCESRSRGDAGVALTNNVKGKSKGKDESFIEYCRHEPVILMHHLFIGGFGFITIVYLRGGLGDCVFGFVYLMEFSTPFVSMRGILSRLRMKTTRTYTLNGIAMLLTFFICRVLSLPYVCYLYSRVLDLTYIEAIESLPTGCKISIAILLLPQIYWFYLMSAGAFKVFFCNQKEMKTCSSLSGIDGDGDDKDKAS